MNQTAAETFQKPVGKLSIKAQKPVEKHRYIPRETADMSMNRVCSIFGIGNAFETVDLIY
jgi:hypothetical protein